MIPYYTELDNPEGQSFFLQDLSPINYHYVSGVKLPDSFYLKTTELFKKSKLILSLIPLTTFENFPDISYNEWLHLGDLISYIDRNIHFLIDSIVVIELNPQNEETMWGVYCTLARDFQEFFPKWREELQEIYNLSKEIITDIKRYTTIKIEPEKYIDVTLENAWFILPSNHLYNSGGEDGHKEGNLVYEWWLFCGSAERKMTPTFPSPDYYSEQADRISKRGYVSEAQVTSYGNYLPTLLCIETRETDFDRLREKVFQNKLEHEGKNGPFYNIKEFRKIADEYFKGDDPAPVRSYQRNLITLIGGYYRALSDWYVALSRLNGSHNNELLNDLVNRCNHSQLDFLIRFCGFSKVETTVPKTITTSRLNVYEDFYEYLNRGWDIRLLPPLIYDVENDRAVEIDLHSPMIEHFLAKEAEKYPELQGKGKGRVLIIPPRMVPLYPIADGVEKEFINAVITQEFGSPKKICYSRSVMEGDARPQEYRNEKYTQDIYNVDGISEVVCAGKNSSGKEFVSVKVNNRLYYMEKAATKYHSAVRSISVIENGIEKMIRAELSPGLEKSLTTEIAINAADSLYNLGIVYCEEYGIFGIKQGHCGLEDIETLPLTIDCYQKMCRELLKDFSPPIASIIDQVFPFFAEAYSERLNDRSIEDTQQEESAANRRKLEDELPFRSMPTDEYEELVKLIFGGVDPNKEEPTDLIIPYRKSKYLSNPFTGK